MTILDQLADHARERVAQAKRQCSFTALRAQAEQMPKGDFAFEKKLAQSGIRFICEFDTPHGERRGILGSLTTAYEVLQGLPERMGSGVSRPTV